MGDLLCVLSPFFDAKANIEFQKRKERLLPVLKRQQKINFFHLHRLVFSAFDKSSVWANRLPAMLLYLFFSWETEEKDEEGEGGSKTGNCGGKCRASFGGGRGEDQKESNSPNLMAKKKAINLSFVFTIGESLTPIAGHLLLLFSPRSPSHPECSLCAMTDLERNS